jgi:hypothetical protein
MIGPGGRVGIGLVALALLVGACGGGGGKATPSSSRTTSLAGGYGCYYKGDTNSPQVGYELRREGTFTIHSIDRAVDNTTGSWSARGDTGAFEIKGKKEPFTVQGNYLVFAEHPPREWFVRSYDAPSSTVFRCFRGG